MGVIHKDDLSLKSMPNLSHDWKADFYDKHRMKDSAGSDYKRDFLKRTKEAREGARFTQEQIAQILQITQDTYKQYETRSLLPHRLVGPFCIATRVSETWLLTGAAQSSPRRRSIVARTA